MGKTIFARSLINNQIERPGLRYETCYGCGERWNIPKKYILPPQGYLCPKCRDKKRRGLL